MVFPLDPPLSTFNKCTTSINLTPTGIGSDYGSSGYVRIGSEVMAFTRSGDTLTLTRAQKGTTASTHQQGDTVQLCYQVVGQTAQNIVYDLLVNYAFVDPSFIDKSAWDAEQVGYLPRLYNTLVTTPTGVSKLLTVIALLYSLGLNEGNFYKIFSRLFFCIFLVSLVYHHQRIFHHVCLGCPWMILLVLRCNLVCCF